MKDWVMIHKIRTTHDSGDGASIKQISRFYKLSRNTVRKYLRMDEKAIQAAQDWLWCQERLPHLICRPILT